MRAGPTRWLRVLLQWLVLAGVGGGLILLALTRPQIDDSLLLLALAALWIFLGIPACCGLKR